MGRFTDSFGIEFEPVADERAVVLGGRARFTVLTSRLLRLEHSPTRTFEDRASQVFWYRRQVVPSFEVRRVEDSVELETEHLLLQYAGGDFNRQSLTIRLKESGERWHQGAVDGLNLRGTARTLDDVDGAMDLEQGLISRSGWSVWEDTQQLVFAEDGWLVQRTEEEGYKDLYFFGYGSDYYGCLREFGQVAGQVGMVPRWALGNWWSRYWAYSAEELLCLMDEFAAHDIPLSVCIVDMDWHLVTTGNSCSGWTGYTWNRNLFPDPEAFISGLHARGLKTALNLHPAEGIHPHEAQYERVAEAMGVDPASKKPIPFAIDDARFSKAYFEMLHHPYEAQGVDFWWIDWQQGKATNLPGLDPLWWLNHLHYYDLGRNGQKLPFIFSRWGGLGNHRYPIGFSGDTHVTWDSLAFQPYFTATAANVNYGWWSHDIGGHMGGIEDPELFARWVQFGVFSPILRLHCTNNPYHERRPWGYDAETARVTSEAMRLRQALIPYLHSMAWRNHTEAIPLIRPMYYDHPEDEQAYHCPDQYLFGSGLIAAPFTAPADGDTRLSRQVVWLPAGFWFNFFGGERITGDGWQAVYGELEDMPVFAKAGAIVPMAGETYKDAAVVSLHLFPGADGRFILYEEEGGGGLTAIEQYWEDDTWTVRIGAAEALGEALPHERQFRVLLRSVAEDGAVSVQVDGRPLETAVAEIEEIGSISVGPLALGAASEAVIRVQGNGRSLLRVSDYQAHLLQKMVRAFRLHSDAKEKLALRLEQLVHNPSQLAAFQLSLTESQLRGLAEVLTQAGACRVARREGKGERVLLWNNQGLEAVRMAFAAEELSGLAHSESGPLPKFGAITVQDEQMGFHIGQHTAVGRQTVRSWFDGLVGQVAKERVADLEAVIQFRIGGPQGYVGHLHLKRGDVSLAEGLSRDADATISSDSAAWLRLINGDTQPDEMFLSGELDISGNFNLIAKLASVFSFAQPGVYAGKRWRLDVSYFEGSWLRVGE